MAVRPGDIDALAAAQISPPPAFDLGELPIADGLELPIADAGAFNHVLVAHNKRAPPSTKKGRRRR